MSDNSCRKLLLVIPIATSAYNEPLHRFLEPYIAPDFQLDVKSISQGHPHIASRWDLQENGVHVAHLVYEHRDEYDGIFVSDFDGAGVEAAREVVDVPVIDGFLPQCMAALTLSRTFSIIAPDDSLVSLDLSHPRMIGASDALASIISLNMSVAELSDHEKTVENVCKAARYAIEHDGALAILLGCTAMIGVASEVKAYLRSESTATKGRSLDVPVMDPNICGITYLQALVRAGLVQCKRSYSFPPSLASDA